MATTQGHSPTRIWQADELEVWSQGVNTGILRRNGRALLIGGARLELLERAGVAPESVDWILFTHHERALLGDAGRLAAAAAQVGVPQAERPLFEQAEAFWAGDGWRLHGYHFHPSHRVPRESVPVARGFRHGDVLEWQGLAIRALETPGPTAGGMSYLVALEGVTTAFTGDLICAPGRIWEFHGLQGTRPLPDGGALMEYHGFGERAADVTASLDAVIEAGAAVLAPGRGVVMDSPREAVEALRANLNACLACYHSTTAARWHFAGARPEWPTDRSEMLARCRPLPAWVLEPGDTSRALVAEGGQVFLIDCHGEVPERIAALQETGQLGKVEFLWITHYHDDHVGRVNDLRAREACTVIGHESMIDILRRPQAYLMPCLDPHPIHVDRVTRDRESWEWRGFRLTAFTCPGQSLYDAALLVQRGDESVLFVGDSLAPGGIDDYCVPNRNLLGERVGYDYCLRLLASLPFSGLLINEHVPGTFTFTPDELAGLRRALARRRELFRRLLPWDDPNYGLDHQWVRADPYYREARPGETVAWDLCVRNHSCGDRDTTATLLAPQGWTPVEGSGATVVPPGQERRIRLAARAPASNGRQVVGFTMVYDGLLLPEAAEAIIDVGSIA